MNSLLHGASRGTETFILTPPSDTGSIPQTRAIIYSVRKQAGNKKRNKMFELEIDGKFTKFDSSAHAENSLGHAVADRKEAWLYLNDNTLAYSPGNGEVFDRRGVYKSLSSPLYLSH